MDEPGFHARRRAAKERDGRYYDHLQKGPDGRYLGYEEAPEPMNGPWVPPIPPRPSPGPSSPERYGSTSHSLLPPPLPPRMPVPVHHQRHDSASSSHSSFQYPPSPSSYYPPSPHYAPSSASQASFAPSSSTVTLSAAQRAQSLPRTAQMSPHLQLMCGPLLRYDTVENGIWYGAVMVVSVDAGSQYEPHPMLDIEWDPERPVHHNPKRPGGARNPTVMMQLSAQQPEFNPGALPSAPTLQPGTYLPSASFRSQIAPGHEIWVYNGVGGPCTFWRFMIEVPLGPREMGVRYRVNGGQQIEFFVPAVDQDMRWAAHSCNGFSAGINQDDFRGPGFASGYDPVWSDLLEHHAAMPYHVLVGGGDQLYCDALTREPEMQGWINAKTEREKIAYPLTEDMRLAIDRFYFRHYCTSFRRGAFAQANSSIPMMNMLDDHDLIDGFGSYPDNLQSSDVFRTIGSRGYFFYLLFQCFTVDEVDGTNHHRGAHTFKSMLIGGDGPWIPQPTHSVLTYLGPHVYMLLLDCRGERRKTQVCSETTYGRAFERIYQLPPQVEHLVIQLGIPIAYPRMNFLETALESKFNPIIALGRNGSLGLGSMVNKFNTDAELLDDLNDHWTAKCHKRERNWFVVECQKIALNKRMRVSYLTGDVHCAAVGVFKSLAKGWGRGIDPAKDHRYMIDVTSSAIVNTPPPVGVLTMVSMLADKQHKTMHDVQTDECMLPIFQRDTNGTPLKSKMIMGRRNWCSVMRDNSTGELEFDIRVEKVKGRGETVGYAVRTPPPQW
ncbi:hypothetical protein BOTBODRAFT_39397 [Botryobasidium botryosum FD-172 SS1]|uniref:PhoD-like phosphatase domain-containing protein n=1 Tax=Botryobasidium botryosum (strain FD-172 SS1) TaxID=930990 RepID=A0A067M4F5_BOTB1|nr:hypothetical protein BOTBODRAFT_39397 [Botryobasidium botryosum FD-172 SS1]